MDTLAETIVEETGVDLRISGKPPNSPYHITTSWTDERVEMLKKLYADGLPASAIAGELGGITRNAVIGKVHRLGLTPRGKSGGTRVANPLGAKPRARRMNPMQSPVLPVPHRFVLPIPAHDANAIPLEQRKTLLELDDHHCRFPYGDPGQSDFFFCGAPGANLHAGRPYCPGHHAVAFNGIPAPRASTVIRFNTSGMAGVAR